MLRSLGRIPLRIPAYIPTVGKWGAVEDEPEPLPALAIASTAKGGTTAVDTTAHAITMPSGVTTGDLVVVCFSCDSNPVVQIDWASSVGLWQQSGLNRNSTNVSQTIFFAPYTSGLALAITTSNAQQSSFIAHRIPDADYCTVGYASGDSTNSAPAAFTHPSGAQDMLAIVFRSGDSNVVPTVSPTGYSTIDNQAASGTSGASTSSAYKSLTAAASDTPGVFTVAAEQWACATVFVCRGTPIPRFDALGGIFPTVTEPAYLVPYWDAHHGVWLTKVTDSGAAVSGTTWRAKNHHEYPSVGAWNCDQTLLYLETAFTDSDRCFLDATTFAVAHKTTRPASWQTGRWSKTNPLLMYYTTGTAIRTFNVSTGATAATTSDFSAYTDVSFGQNEGDFSDDGLRIALMAVRTSDTHSVALICTVTPGSPDTITITATIDITALGKPPGEGKAAISPNGDLVLLYFGDETQAIYTYLGVLVYTAATEQDPSHSDWTIYNGEQVIVGSDSATGGDIVRRSSVTDTVTEINGNSWCYHTSARNTVNRGFCVSSYHFDSGVPYVGEIAAPLLSGARTYRICHDFASVDTAYDNERHPTVSPDGKFIVFESDWGTAAAVDVYVADFSHMNLP